MSAGAGRRRRPPVGDHGQMPNARSRPPAGGERAALAALLRRKSVQCSALGSPLYAELLQRAAADVAAGGVCLAVLRGHGGDPPGSALALRFMSAVHRAVLDGNAPRLARHYRSAGGTHGPHGAWPAFRELVADQRELLRELVCRPIQTNEAGRCAALLPGWLAIAAETRLPLRLLEVGASAGLILRFDRYRYETQGGCWGPAGSPVRLDGFEGKPGFAPIVVASRRGCDLEPLDPRDEETRIRLRCTVWADQLERLRLLDSALALARGFPVRVDRAPAGGWLQEQLGRRVAGEATVVFHSIVWQYLTDPERERLRSLLTTAASRATPEAPLAWLRMEPAGGVAQVTLTTWPKGRERVLAQAGYHGRPVRLCPTISSGDREG